MGGEGDESEGEERGREVRGDMTFGGIGVKMNKIMKVWVSWVKMRRLKAKVEHKGKNFGQDVKENVSQSEGRGKNT